MIDLSMYQNRCVEFLINGELIKVPEMTNKQYEKVLAYEAKEGASIQEQRELVLEMLNRNTSGKKFTDKDIAELPQGAVMRIYTECVMLPRKALIDPN